MSSGPDFNPGLKTHADHQSTCTPGPQPGTEEKQIPRIARLPATPWRLLAREDHDPQEAELRVA
jgi:hypothetical protein